MQKLEGGVKPRIGKNKSKSKGKQTKSSKRSSANKSKLPKKRNNKTSKKTKYQKKQKKNKMKEIETMWNTIFDTSVDNQTTDIATEPIINTDQNTDQNTDVKPVVIVLIHADWCGHCKTLQPEWDIMEKSLSDGEMNNIAFEVIESADLDNKLPILSNKYMNGKQITHSGFPTIGNIHNGQFEQYGGERSSNDLLDWIRGLISKV